MGTLKRVLQISLFGLLAIGLGVGSFHTSTAEAVDRNLIRLYVDGNTKTLSSKAKTIAEALEELDVTLGEYDVVEPALHTPIEASPFHINVFRGEPVRIVDDGTVIDSVSAYQSPRLIAQQAGLETAAEDIVRMERIDDFVAEQFVGNKVTIDRATPLAITIDDRTFTIRTHKNTVGEALDEIGLSLGANDFTSPGPAALVAETNNVSVVRVGYETGSEEVAVAYSTQVIVDNSMLVGLEQVDVEGRDGLEVVTYSLQNHNGTVVDKTEISRAVVRQPQPKVVRRGGKIPDPNDNRDIGLVMAAERGWTGEQWVCLERLWTKESQWRHYADNPNSSAYGIPQALPGSKMSTHGADWKTNPKTQIAWGMDYIKGRYGTPCGAWSHSQVKNWY